MFDLKAWGAPKAKATHHTYTILGVSDTQLRVLRSDKTEEQIFSRATFADLMEKGRLEVIDNKTFKVEIDKDWKPANQFKTIEELEA